MSEVIRWFLENRERLIKESLGDRINLEGCPISEKMGRKLVKELEKDFVEKVRKGRIEVTVT